MWICQHQALSGPLHCLNLTCSDCLAGQVLFEDAADLALFGVTPRFLLRIQQLTVHHEFEQATAGRNQVPGSDVRQKFLVTEQICRQTDGLGGVVSRGAIGQGDIERTVLHHRSPFPYDESNKANRFMKASQDGIHDTQYTGFARKRESRRLFNARRPVRPARRAGDAADRRARGRRPPGAVPRRPPLKPGPAGSSGGAQRGRGMSGKFPRRGHRR